MSKGYNSGPLMAKPEPGSASGGLYMVVDTSRTDATVCTASYCQEADAHLYAAAPELLEALKALREEVCGVDQWWGKLREAVDAADDALVKAEPLAPSQDPA